MKRGFYTIMAAQFVSSLADNALLIAAIAQLLELDGPAWMVPLLKFFFTVSYVALAAFVGAFADAIPKGRVMFITNTIKIAGCVMLFFTGYVEFVGIPEYAGAHRVCGRRIRGGGVFAGEVRNPHRAAAPGKTGACQRLDR